MNGAFELAYGITTWVEFYDYKGDLKEMGKLQFTIKLVEFHKNKNI